MSEPKIWLTSDWHFNHDREFIWKSRGFNNIQEMNEAIVRRHNEVVSSEDIVYVLGDGCLGGGSKDILLANKTLIESLNGQIHYFAGNHDTDPRIMMYASCKNIVQIHGWADMVKYKGYHFYLSHFPTITGNLEKESLKQCTLNLFGHTHQIGNFFYDLPYMYHVGMDSHNCYPVCIDDIIEEMNRKVSECLEKI